MAATNARLGYGGQVSISTDLTTANLFVIEEVRSFGVPQDEADEHEVSHMSSPSRRKEFIAGMVDAGEVEISMNYKPDPVTTSVDKKLRDALAAGTPRAVRFQIATAAGVITGGWQIDTFGFVKKYVADTVEPNAPITATLVIRITGAQSQGPSA